MKQNRKSLSRFISFVLSMTILVSTLVISASATTFDLSESDVNLDWNVSNKSWQGTADYFTTESTYLKFSSAKSDVQTSVNMALWKKGGTEASSEISKNLSSVTSMTYSFSGCTSSNTYTIKFYQMSGSTINLTGKIKQ